MQQRPLYDVCSLSTTFECSREAAARETAADMTWSWYSSWGRRCCMN